MWVECMEIIGGTTVNKLERVPATHEENERHVIESDLRGVSFDRVFQKSLKEDT